MKIRNGFVSNSSSSSFVLLATLKKHEEVIKDFKEFEEEIVLENISMTTFNGVACVTFHEYETDEGGGFQWSKTAVPYPEDYLENNRYVPDYYSDEDIDGTVIQTVMNKYKASMCNKDDNQVFISHVNV